MSPFIIPLSSLGSEKEDRGPGGVWRLDQHPHQSNSLPWENFFENGSTVLNLTGTCKLCDVSWDTLEPCQVLHVLFYLSKVMSDVTLIELYSQEKIESKDLTH